jgi:hypothetical protein
MDVSGRWGCTEGRVVLFLVFMATEGRLVLLPVSIASDGGLIAEAQAGVTSIVAGACGIPSRLFVRK